MLGAKVNLIIRHLWYSILNDFFFLYLEK